MPQSKEPFTSLEREMKYKLLSIVVSCLSFGTSFNASSTVCQRHSLAGKPAQLRKTPSSPQKIVLLSQSESFDFLADLNQQGKLMPQSVFPNVQYAGLKLENCFGIRLANGRRLAGESSPTGYGYTGSLTEETSPGTFAREQSFRLAGFMYSEFPFTIAGQQLPAGPYVVEVFSNSLRLVGDDNERKMSVGGRLVPSTQSAKLTVKAPIPDEYVSKNASKDAQFSLAISAASQIVLRLLSNEWVLVPQEDASRPRN